MRRAGVRMAVLAMAMAVLVAGCAPAGGQDRPGGQVSPGAVADCPSPTGPPTGPATSQATGPATSPAAGAGGILPPAGSAPAPAAYAVEVRQRLPHDEDAFTQGLVHDAGRLVEGTGGYGESEVRVLDPVSGRAGAREQLPEEVFGEGLALHGGRLYQLTWTEEVGYVRDRCTLRELGRLTYDGEGWGLASDGRVLWRSDGSHLLTAHDPSSFAPVRRLPVTDRGVPVARLNELEVVDGDLLANVWLTDHIARIDLDTGAVVGWLDAGVLAAEVAYAAGADRDAVLNGIAADPATGRLWLTGKRWPTLFEVAVVEGGRLPPAGRP